MMRYLSYTKKIVFLVCFVFSLTGFAQSLEKEASSKIKNLEKLIEKAEKKGIDVLKEKTTIRTAEIFLEFANWDEKNEKINTEAFQKVQSYKKDAVKMAKDLPSFERKDVILMLDEATDYLSLLLEKKVFRTESPKVDWKKAFVKEDQIIYNKTPVFLADYTWKPKSKNLTEYHGNQDGFFLTPSYVINEKGDLQSRKKAELESKNTGSLGFVFFNHKGVPKWAEKKYGPNFRMREDTYTTYDIDNPGAREIQKNLIAAVVPHTAGKKFSELGYMLCNEPHFYTHTDATKSKLPWASGGVSNFTIEKFKVWLSEKHQNIAALNSAWGTSFKKFDDVQIAIPIDISLKGSAKWYDWAVFNMYRVTEWYRFMKTEIQKYDKEGKVHLKIMPNLWTDNARVHGIDLEALTSLSGIIGNDSGAEHKRIWRKNPYEWEAHYAFDWRELCMGFDFMKSVSPNKINFNSELHYLSTGRSRDLYQDPKYARATFWLAHTYGMTASQIWFWPRKEDGSVNFKKEMKGYPGSNNQQPRITNEVAMTLIDLNAFGEDIMSLQRERKPLRIFYSKTSAINKAKHMDDIFELYESLHFDGVPLGFVTKDILNNQKPNNWDVVLVHDTQFVTKQELKALQDYLNKGGIVLLDSKSLKKDEYGNSLGKLKAGKGQLIQINTVEEFKTKSFEILGQKGHISDVTITETNAVGTKTCVWKVTQNKAGNNVLSVVNVGKSDATLNIQLKGASKIICKDLIKGIATSSNPTLKPNEAYFVEITKK
ncbi:beta-galactosidase [Flavicella sediminum]|uniref:beta-galactosidase n=1 Tax=Flavicella sediminum TaxID=2585141 RepID=UPI001121302B|nr:beta-galactosidase [Flavicella sediminum]